jgi:glutamate 5-kinase
MYKRIVIKLGTNVLTGGGKQFDQARIVEIVRQCAELHNSGNDVVVCSSGAIAAGRATLGFPSPCRPPFRASRCWPQSASRA